jgi:predicted nucleic acid-binding protein
MMEPGDAANYLALAPTEGRPMTQTGNFADGVIGATAIERGSTLVTHDQALIDAVNALGGSARKP